ncbi:MAG: penicillin-binding protein [Solirubrobacteraceae bacterium]|jgi:penicillin-binding protein 1A|nr:penicillin-binding protein [Solirubrobacteraceae bacterium]
MQDDDRPAPLIDDGPEPIPFARPPFPPSAGRPRIKKLRLFLILLGLALLALISTVFGMMMAVASDLPALENRSEYKNAKNSILKDHNGHFLGVLTGRDNRIIVQSNQIAPAMKSAIVAIEDRRFYSNEGVDVRGIARAFVADVVSKRAVQGGSTITQQFVKNALRAQAKRTLFQKLREAALAYHLSHKWSKDKILTEYLNAIYFGNGAYGIESAARTYFGNDVNHLGCGTNARPCAAELKPEEAALLAGLVASPGKYDPVSHPAAAEARRNLVLRRMLDQGYLRRPEYVRATEPGPPPASQVRPPVEKTVIPSAAYFTSWIKQQLVDRYGARRAFEGGLTIRTTLDLDLQKAAVQAVDRYLSDPNGPSAALVALDNQTGEIRAMVGGRDYAKEPFNLATQGQRQPGSAFKPFVLAEALQRGVGPGSVWPSRQRDFIVPGTHRKEHFVVRNYEGNYSGSSTLARATTFSDNSVFAAVGIHVGTARIARLAERMGIRTPVSHNYAITLGGLKEGVTPLDMAHAYQTIARRGRLVSGTLGAAKNGPVGVHKVEAPKGEHVARLPEVNKTRYVRVLPDAIANTETQILTSVVQVGTGRAAAIGDFAAGKTGTTENYGDAWFVGFTDRYTVAVWVGYPHALKPMKTEYHGKPVAGGTYPAQIWHDFIVAARTIDQDRAAKYALAHGKPPPVTTTPAPVTPAVTTPATTPPTTTVAPPAKTVPTTPPARTPTTPPPTTPTTPPTTTTGGGTPPPGTGQPSNGQGGDGNG